MTPVKVPTALCADAAPGQETAATNATAAKDDFDMLNLLLRQVINLQQNLWMPTIPSLIWNWAVQRMEHRGPRRQATSSGTVKRESVGEHSDRS
jgi:hypothetical protein